MIKTDFQISDQLDFLSSATPFDEGFLTKMTDGNTDQQNTNSSNLSSEFSLSDSSASYKSTEALDINYSNCNGTQNSKRKLFTKEEDNLLAMAAMKFNQGSWNDIAKLVPGRTPKQCRDRWTNYLQPSLKFDPWTNQEDKNLISLVKANGTHWRKMKRYFPGRSTNSLKNRWHWLINNQSKPISSKKLTKSTEKTRGKKTNRRQSNNENIKNNFSEINIGNNYQIDGYNLNSETTNSIVNQDKIESQNIILGSNMNGNKSKINSKTSEKINYLDINLENILGINQNIFNEKNNNNIYEENGPITINPDDFEW